MLCAVYWGRAAKIVTGQSIFKNFPEKTFPRQVFLCSPTNALLSAALVSFDQALKAGHVKTNKFNALWIFNSMPQGRLVKRHKRRVEHGILG
jgi:hypothetical protein